MRLAILAALVALLALHAPAARSAEPAAEPAADELYTQLDTAFEMWIAENHVPGLVWGVVIDGKLVHIKGFGVQDLGDARRPVTADSGFRIASMSKAFTAWSILKLRDAGKLRLDDPAWKYIPEIKSWGTDITVADLLHHSAGFVTDDPWGDRQQVMSEADFTKLLKVGVPRTAPRGTRYEYSNLGYAMLGRIISNVSAMNFSRYVSANVFSPLGMRATTYENADVPVATRAIGYRWENEAWAEEPYMRHGAFGSMGGITTSANDYSKWIAYLLSAWPVESATSKPAKTIRAMQYGGGLTHVRRRPGAEGAACRITPSYGAGLVTANDCVLGQVLFHGGGFPGYGSHMLLIPEAGAGVFALSNRTYAGPSAPVWDAATALFKSGVIKPRELPVSASLGSAYEAAKAIWQSQSPVARRDLLAMNFFMDRSEANWSGLLNDLNQRVGACDLNTPIAPTGQLSGKFVWNCATGKISGNLLLAPTPAVQIQSLSFEVTN